MDFSRKTGAQRSRIHEEEIEGYYILFLLLLIRPQLEFRQFVTDMRKDVCLGRIFLYCFEWL